MFLSPGANLGDVMKTLYMTVGRGSALYSPMEHRNMPGNNTIRVIILSCRVQRNSPYATDQLPWAEVAYSHDGVTAAQGQSACVQAAAGRAWYMRV